MKAVDYIGLPPGKPLEIEYDQRERLPYKFHPKYAKTTPAHLKTFDYRLKNDFWAVERKSIPDLIQSFFCHGKRELRKVERAKDEFKGLPIIYCIDGTVGDIVKEKNGVFRHMRRGNSQGFISHIFSLAMKHNFVLQWCRDREEASLVMYRLLKNREKQLKKEQR